MSSQTPNTNGYYSDVDYDKHQINDSITIGNFLWLATNNGVIKINQTTRERIHYTKENSNLPDNLVETITTNKRAAGWIGTYGNRMAFINEDEKWEAVPYDLDLFGAGTVEKDGKVFIKGDKDNWLRTNFIHFDVNDTLWVGTSIGLFKLLYESKAPKWSGPFNPISKNDQTFNVLFIRDVVGGIEVSGNFGKRGYQKPVGNVRTYRLPNLISADNNNWRAATEAVITEEVVTKEEVLKAVRTN